MYMNRRHTTTAFFALTAVLLLSSLAASAEEGQSAAKPATAVDPMSVGLRREETIDLSGSWQLALDPNNRGMAAGYATRALPSSVRLPGCLQEQGFGGKPGPDTLWWLGREKRKKVTPAFPFLARYHTAENFRTFECLVPDRHYIGAAWFARDVEIPSPWKGSRNGDAASL